MVAYQSQFVVILSELTISYLKSGNPFFLVLLSLFLSKEVPVDFSEDVSNWIESFPTSQGQESTLRNLNEMLRDIS